ncbi:CPBP family intramembrane metalloprotease [Ciceribacter sp. L1K23]|uniref:CPBP family intramembrane glutamic endopeptidase n=1 Tax=Ciceribacter sp. L1K23 TaxID=2820276 RepID=UPI001B80F819|nr:type II CAAX endopeptidase family protein [Ciceribacter sp. L1K23]MBR0556435.1 CPBP family intramembrane metalloprotease [Ciceribacter sp. L1K23]
MKKYRKFWIALAILPLWMGVTLVVGFIRPRQAANQAVLISEGLVDGIIAASIFLLIVLALLKWDRLGLQWPKPPRSVLVTWLPSLYIVAILVISTTLGLPPVATMAIVFINCAFVGFSEEVMFRGILFRGALSAMRVLPAIFFTSAIFGLIHTLNTFATGQLDVAIAQAVAAFMSGLLFNVIRVRTQSVFPMIVLHTLWNFSLFMLVHASDGVNETVTITPATLIAPALMILPLLGYGIYLMRGIERDFGWMSDVSSRAVLQPAA